MDQYQVVPWDHLVDTMSPGVVLEQYVPPELEELAYQVMKQYDMQVSSMVLVTSKPDKGGAIWKIETNKGTRSIKVLHRIPQRSLFSVGAQQYLVEQGARVPALIPTIEGQLYVEAGGKLWIVTDWIALQQASKIDLEGASALCKGLGEFHFHTKGYVPPHGSARSSRLYGWIKNYEKIIAKIGWFKHIAEAYRDTAGSDLLLQVVDDFDRQAREALDRFLTSSYAKMTAMGESYWGLAHQDYGWSNGQMGPGGIWVIDLDGVAYDLPFRDLRKLITSTMDDMGVWDLTWIRGMIEAYNQGNPMDREMFEILWIDMAFPNEFYKHVKEIVFDPVTFMNMELTPILQRVLTTESTKAQALQELWKDIDKYPAGDYIVQPVEMEWDLPLPPIGVVPSASSDASAFAFDGTASATLDGVETPTWNEQDSTSTLNLQSKEIANRAGSAHDDGKEAASEPSLAVAVEDPAVNPLPIEPPLFSALPAAEATSPPVRRRRVPKYAAKSRRSRKGKSSSLKRKSSRSYSNSRQKTKRPVRTKRRQTTAKRSLQQRRSAAKRTIRRTRRQIRTRKTA
ncbi:CotS family spore coat protein [Paenibacillus aquistagni]|uniref:CotS family spore coat protein n=1 Tax=Paenibacillus aquistagni TaxID=1852522 RepID=UPI000B513ADF|nr:CotS family spore coat protein [Paenibacillus aquistagni]